MNRTIRIDSKAYDIASDDDYLATMPPDFEPAMVALFKALIAPGMVVADVGANIGLTALLFATLARQVAAFEPAPSTFALLQRNLARSGCTNVEAVNLGLGDTSQELTLTFHSRNRSGGFVSGHVKLGTDYTTEQIRIDTLDNFYARTGTLPDFIKIDVEGFEPHVIRGGKTLMATHKPTVVLELNHFCLNVLQRVTLPDFFDQLRGVFPLLFAIGADNKSIVDLHIPDNAYHVMHAHVTSFAYPNIVAGFDPVLQTRLADLCANA